MTSLRSLSSKYWIVFELALNTGIDIGLISAAELQYTSGNCLSLWSSKIGWLEWLEANTRHFVLAWAEFSNWVFWYGESYILFCFIDILPATTFKHLENNTAFRWTNSFFFNKVKIISCILFWCLIFFISSEYLWLHRWDTTKLMNLMV